MKAKRFFLIWFPILFLYFYTFCIVLDLGYFNRYFSVLPIWGWLVMYFITIFLIKLFFKKDFLEHAENIQLINKRKKDVNLFGIESDIFLLFIFSLLTFAFIMFSAGHILIKSLKI